MSAQLGFFAIYDAKVGVFMRPLLARNPLEAARSFGDAVRHPESDYGRHPEDYSLFHVGFWYENEGRLEPITAPVQICTALSIVEAVNGGAVPALVKEA